MIKIVSYMRCPYCSVWVKGKHGKRIPKNVGKYKVKIIDSSNVLIFKCERCNKSFRVAMRGSILLWDDMTKEEKQAFNNNYNYKNISYKEDNENGKKKRV